MAPLDADLDGVADTADNCPLVPNAGQQDEDQDGAGDACDNCPGTPNASQANDDGDALGNLCDPNPAVAGDSLALFEPFNNALGAGWSTQAGTFSVVGGDLVQDAAGFAAVVYTGLTAANVRVEVGFSLVEYVPNATSIDNFWVFFRGQPGPSGYICSARHSTPETAAIFIMTNGSALSPTATATQPAPLPTGTPLLLTAQAQGSVISCTVGAAGTQIANATYSGTQVGIFTDDTRVLVHWVAVYQLP